MQKESILKAFEAYKSKAQAASAIFLMMIEERQIKSISKEIANDLRKDFKKEVIPFIPFYGTKAGNDALCHGLKALIKRLEEPKDMPKDEPKDEPKDMPKDEPKDEPKDMPKKGKKIRASEYEYIKACIQENICIYLYGPAGSGKTQLAMDLADDLGLDFYCTSSVLEAVQLSGYSDGYGKFHSTAFSEAFTKGGLFLFDEIDISNPIEVKAFNMALSQKIYNFDGKLIKAHPNFRVIAAGNTLGTGADADYCGVELDPSVRDRFEAVYFGYDKRIEMLIAKGNKDLVDFTEDLRKAVKDCNMSFVVSYRSLCKFMQKEGLLKRGVCSLDKAINQSFVSFLDIDNKAVLAQNIKGSSKYHEAFRNCVKYNNY